MTNNMICKECGFAKAKYNLSQSEIQSKTCVDCMGMKNELIPVDTIPVNPVDLYWRYVTKKELMRL